MNRSVKKGFKSLTEQKKFFNFLYQRKCNIFLLQLPFIFKKPHLRESVLHDVYSIYLSPITNQYVTFVLDQAVCNG